MNGKYDRNVALLCPTCAGGGFEIREEKDEHECQSCGKISTYDELITANSERIENEVGQIRSEVVKDIEKQFQKITKRLGRSK